MNDNGTMKLLGTISPLAEGPSFAIPIFFDSLRKYVQKIDDHDIIVAFDEVSHPGDGLHLTTMQRERKSGDPALWAVDFGNGEPLVETRAIVAEKLRDRFAQYLSKPFFLLDIAEFLADAEIMRRALFRAMEQLEEIDHAMARDWLISYCSRMLRDSLIDHNLRKQIHVSMKKLDRVQRKKLKPIEDSVEVVNRAVRKKLGTREETRMEDPLGRIIGESDSIKNIRSLVKRLAVDDTPILIQGESGTGKELVAKAIHYNSPRKGKPFVTLNCGAIPESFIESEFFGHMKGAFTDAIAPKKGMFEVADGGTIFLDEISELPLLMQAKLLGVLQDKEFKRVGGTDGIRVDVRIIAATNRQLEEAVREKHFRKDLFCHLMAMQIELPPLRERQEDIPLFVNYFVNHFSRKMGKVIETVPKELMKALQNCYWLENVRELESVIFRAVIASQDRTLRLAEELSNLRKEEGGIDSVERDLIRKELKRAQWRIDGQEGAAARLGFTEKTLHVEMSKLGMVHEIKKSEMS